MTDKCAYDVMYEDTIDMLIESKSDIIIDNKNYDHARSLIKALVSKVKVKDYIGVFTGQLHPQGYSPPEIVNAFKSKLDQNIKLKILFQTAPADEIKDTLFYKEILNNDKYSKSVYLRVLKDAYSTFDKHLLTSNEKAFRLETSHEETRAKASFNNPCGIELRKGFEKLFGDHYSRPLTLA